MSTQLIPNTFQHPNAYIDWLSYYLTPEEEKVLNKAVREIIGWHHKIESRRGRIALSVFVEGKDRYGQQLCMGCGLSKDAVRKALASLDAFNILKKVGILNNNGQEYELVEDWDALEWDLLRARRDVWDEENRSRTDAARKALEKTRQEGGIVGQYAEGVLSDSTKETQASLETQNRSAPSKKTRKKPFSPLPEEGYRVEYYFKDKEFVEAIGTVSVGPWRVKTCLDCGGEIVIEERDVFVGCRCGMHEYKLLSHRPKPEVKVHPAIVILRKKIGQRQLNQEQITLVESTVGENQKDLDFWRDVVVAWLQHGWYEANIAGMIGWYNRREIPYTGRKVEAEQAAPVRKFIATEDWPTEEEYREALAYAKAQEGKGGI